MVTHTQQTFHIVFLHFFLHGLLQGFEVCSRILRQVWRIYVREIGFLLCLGETHRDAEKTQVKPQSERLPGEERMTCAIIIEQHGLTFAASACEILRKECPFTPRI